MLNNKIIKRQTNNDIKDQNKSNSIPKPQKNINNKQSYIQLEEQEKSNQAQRNMIWDIQRAKQDLNEIIQYDGQKISEREENFYKKYGNPHKPKIFDKIKLLEKELIKQLIFTQNMIDGKKQLQKQSFLFIIMQKIFTFFEVLKNVLCNSFNKNRHQVLIKQDISNNNSQDSFISEISEQDQIKYLKKMCDQQFIVKDLFQQLIKQFSFFTQYVYNQNYNQESQLIQNEQKIKELELKIQNLNQDNLKLLYQVEQLKQQNDQKLYIPNISQTVQTNLNYDTNQNEAKLTEKNDQKNLNINSQINPIIEIPLKLENQIQQNELVCTNISDISQIVMLLSLNDTGKKFLMKTLFPKLKETQFYQKYYQNELDLKIVDTACFQFEDFKERQNQIQQYKQIFSDNRNQYLGFWIAVEFQESNSMKKNVMQIYKYIRGLELPISMIVTDFHLSENKDHDQKEIISKFKIFNYKQIVFIDNQIKYEDMIHKLKQTFYENQERMESIQIQIEDTIFEDEHPEFEK